MNNSRSCAEHISAVMRSYLADLDFKVRHSDEPLGISTGFKNLDRKSEGFSAGEVILIGGRPAMGKTSFAVNLAYNMATNFHLQKQQNAADDKCVVYITLEASKKWMAKSLLSFMSSVPRYEIHNCQELLNIFEKLAEASRQIEELPLYLADTDANIESIAAELQKIVRQQQIGCVIIDYLQMFEDYSSATEDYSEVVAEIKKLAAVYKVPIIVLTQLSRDIEKRADKTPLLCDIRGLNKHLNNADKVLFLYREAYYLWLCEPQKRKKETTEQYIRRYKDWEERCKKTKYSCDIIIARNNNGQCGRIKMFFDWGTGLFKDWQEND